MKYITTNYKQTQKLGEIFAKETLKRSCEKKAIVLGLSGNLGGGKTTFLQGFAKGLGIKDRITSPTFVILKRFVIPTQKIKNQKSKIKDTNQKLKMNKFTDFYHIDCYRLKSHKDILELGFKEIIENSKNIVAIEWPEKIKKVLPKNTTLIKFKFIDKNKREININM